MYANKKILIVDDSVIYRDLVTNILQKMGISQIEIAADGQQAFQKMNDLNPHLVIMDVNMPHMSGIEVCKKIRQSTSPATMPIIIISSKSKRDALQEAFECGANDYFEKPINIAKVSNRVAFYLDYSDKFKQKEKVGKFIKKDLQMARICQKMILPSQSELKQLAQNYKIECSGFYQPSPFLAGDSWGVEKINQSHVLLYMLDIAGHGIKSALYNAFTLGNLKQIICDVQKCSNLQKRLRDKDMLLHEIFLQLNTRLYDMCRGKVFSAFSAVLFCKETQTVNYISSAFPDIVHLQKDAKKIDTYSGRGVPLGLVKNFLRPSSGAFSWRKNDHILVMTDGLPESLPINDHISLKQYGSAMPGELLLKQLYRQVLKHKSLADSAESMIKAVLKEFEEQNYDTTQDDVTIFCCENIL